jgi:hypothetical protein
MNIPGMWITKRSQQTVRTSSTSVDDRSDAFDAVDIPDFSHTFAEGLPRLPVKIYMIEIEQPEIPSVQFVSVAREKISDLKVRPAQPVPPDVFPEPPRLDFVINDQVYSADKLYPESNILSVDVVTMRDKHILVVEVVPVQVNPVTMEGVVTYQYEVVIEAPAVDAPAETSEAADESPIYMILTDDQYQNNASLATLMDWKRKKGLDVRCVFTSQINANGAPSNTEIVNYMRALSTNDYPDYLLIIGDSDQTNGVAGKYFNTSTTDYYGYTDLDIACRTADDYIPDLYYGRLPASSDAEVTLMLNKVIAMDRNPPASSMYQKVVIAGQIQDSDDGGNGEADRLFCETADSLACYFESDPAGVDYDCTRAIVNPDNMTASGTWNSGSLLWNGNEQIGARVADHFLLVAQAQDRITTNVNNGIALLQHRDHGYVNGVGWADPYYTYFHIRSQINNADDTPVVFSVNCNSGMYNFPNNFSREWLIDNNGGAYAVFAPVDTSYSWYNDALTHGFYAAFLSDYISSHNASVSPDWPKNMQAPNGSYGAAGSATRLGEILNFGKMYMEQSLARSETTFRLFHCFGDPEAFLVLREPQTLSVSHPSLLTLGTHTVTVSTAEADCQVCLYSPTAGIQEVQTTDGSGDAEFTLELTENCTIYVTVTGDGVRPYEGTITARNGEAFSCSAFALTTNVVLRWTDPRLSGYTDPRIRISVDTNTYPPDTAAGSVIYTGTNSPYMHTGLTGGQTYYYSFWVTPDGSSWTNPP